MKHEKYVVEKCAQDNMAQTKWNTNLTFIHVVDSLKNNKGTTTKNIRTKIL